MSFPLDLLLNAIVAGLLLGGFYAAVTSGISIAFGILDTVNIAHPAFIILGSYIAYIVNSQFGLDPILVSIVTLPAFYALGAIVYQVYYVSFERRGQEALRGLAFFFGLLFITEVVAGLRQAGQLRTADDGTVDLLAGAPGEGTDPRPARLEAGEIPALEPARVQAGGLRPAGELSRGPGVGPARILLYICSEPAGS